MAYIVLYLLSAILVIRGGLYELMKRRILLYPLMMVVFIIVLFPTMVYADMGPKDKLTIHVKNPPEGLYYLDLLTQETSKYGNFNEDERKTLNQDMVALLYSYEDEGWKPALVEGTGRPMSGDLAGKPSDDERIHTFGYVGLPTTYRVIIVTQRSVISVSDILTRKALQSSLIYDYATGEVTTPNIAITYLMQFLSTCIPTLFVEGVILILFGFSFTNNWRVFLLANIITQIFLTITVGVSLVKTGTLLTYFLQFPVELGILVGETIIYKRYLKGQSPKRRTGYGIIANLVSWGLGLYLLHYQYDFLLKFM